MPTTIVPQVRFRTIEGVRIRYADSGSPQKPTVVLTSPWPESVYAFAPMWASLSEHARLFAVDLPGFGASERREDLLSPRAMGEFLAQLITEAGGSWGPGAPRSGAGRRNRGRPVRGGRPGSRQRLASRLVIIDAGHFVWEEEPAQYASAVLDSITGSWPMTWGSE